MNSSRKPQKLNSKIRSEYSVHIIFADEFQYWFRFGFVFDHNVNDMPVALWYRVTYSDADMRTVGLFVDGVGFSHSGAVQK